MARENSFFGRVCFSLPTMWKIIKSAMTYKGGLSTAILCMLPDDIDGCQVFERATEREEFVRVAARAVLACLAIQLLYSAFYSKSICGHCGVAPFAEVIDGK